MSSAGQAGVPPPDSFTPAAPPTPTSLETLVPTNGNGTSSFSEYTGFDFSFEGLLANSDELDFTQPPPSISSALPISTTALDFLPATTAYSNGAASGVLGGAPGALAKEHDPWSFNFSGGWDGWKPGENGARFVSF
ncbi:hypothetical protein T439DRAFT_327102, partial [Meredithblackwellia eburnea MCA 4105]